MAKRTSMKSRLAKDESKADNTGKGKGEQLELLDVQPKHKKEMVRVGRRYSALVKQRLLLQNGRGGEVELQQKLLDLVKSENLTRDKDGKVKFKIDGVAFELTPTKEKIKVKVDDEE